MVDSSTRVAWGMDDTDDEARSEVMNDVQSRKAEARRSMFSSGNASFDFNSNKSFTEMFDMAAPNGYFAPPFRLIVENCFYLGWIAS